LYSKAKLQVALKTFSISLCFSDSVLLSISSKSADFFLTLSISLSTHIISKSLESADQILYQCLNGKFPL